MSWRDDERLYQPRIHSQRIRELHQLAGISGEYMTVLIDQAIAEFVERRMQNAVNSDESPTLPYQTGMS